MTIGITGAGGHLGMGLVRHALARVPADGIVAITRSPAKLDAFSAQGVQVRAGDFSDPAGLQAAFAGIDRLMIVPTSDLQPGVRLKQHTAAIQAAIASGVGHLTYISTVSARPDPKNELFVSHFGTEQALIASGAAWTILRMDERLHGNAARWRQTGYRIGIVRGRSRRSSGVCGSRRYRRRRCRHSGHFRS